MSAEDDVFKARSSNYILMLLILGYISMCLEEVYAVLTYAANSYYEAC
jgi:hypothetical protein